jgi:prepilin-type N-terminal cleavage/methylation domain-containing protein
MLTPVACGTPARPIRPGRDAFTLIELVVALSLLGVIVAVVGTALARQQRVHGGALALTELRAQLRYAADLLQHDLRSVSAADGDLYPAKMRDSSIEFRSLSATTVACRIPSAAGSSIEIPPPGPLAGGNILSAWYAAPEAGDSILIFDAGDPPRADDRWLGRLVAAVIPIRGACAGSPYLSGGDSASFGFVLSLSAPLSPSIATGAPVHVFRRVHYSLYRSSDGRWYLGSFDCMPSRSPPCATIQPVVGPFNSYAKGDDAARSGLAFSYFDDHDDEVTDASLVRRIGISLRASTRSDASWSGSARRAAEDSIHVVVGLRNHP